jgi:hypothetical protein
MAELSKKIFVAGVVNNSTTGKLDVRLLFDKRYVGEFELSERLVEEFKLQERLERVRLGCMCPRLRNTFPSA